VTRPATASPARRPDRVSPLPLWVQVSADLRRRCASGDFVDGVPGELALCAEYDVSRHTIREALRALRSEGVILSQRGRGSVVRAGFSQNVGAVYSLFRSIEGQGAVQASEVLRLATTVHSPAAHELGLEADAPLVVLERVRRADGEPLAHDVSWLPLAVARPLLDADFGRTALYDELGRLGVHVDAGSERMTAVIPDDRIAAFLGLEPCAPTLFIERRALASGQPVEWRQTHVRGDRFTVETDWTSGTGLTLSMSGASEPTTTMRSRGR
jgi:GntR family transcriptional regulator